LHYAIGMILYNRIGLIRIEGVGRKRFINEL